MKKLLFLIAITLISFPASAQWERIGYPGGYYSIYQFDSTFFAASSANIYRSTDDGVSWTDYSAGLPKTDFFSLKGLYDFSGVFVAHWNTQSNIYSNTMKDTIYGITSRNDIWKTYSRSRIPTTTQIAFGYDTLINLTHSPDSILPYSIYVSIDSGKIWQKRTNNLPDANAYGYNLWISKGRIFAAIYSNDTIIYNDSLKNVQQKYEGYYYSDDLGLHWKILPSSDSNLWWQYLYFPSKDQMYCINMYYPKYKFSILKSNDNGSTWESAMTGIDTGYNSSGVSNLYDFGDKMFLALRVQKDSSDTLFCYYSNNKGSSWSKIPWFTRAGGRWQGVYKRFNRNDYIVLAPPGHNGYVLVDTAFRFVSDFDPLIVPQIGNIARLHKGHIVSYGYPKDSTMESLDYGVTWNQASPLGDSNSNFSEYIGEGSVLIKRVTGSSKHPFVLYMYYRSTDNGISWEEIQFPLGRKQESDLIFANYHDTIIVYYNSPDSVVGTIFRSDDGGGSWREINTPFSEKMYAQSMSMNNYGILIYSYPQPNYSYSSNDYYWTNSTGFFDSKQHFVSIRHSEKYLFTIGYDEYSTKSGYDSTVPIIKRASKKDNKWSELHTNLPNYVFPQDLIVFGSKLILYSRASSEKSNHDGTSRVFISHDNGITWLQIGEPLTMVSKIALDDRFIYAYSADSRGIIYRYPLALAGIHDSKTNSNNSLSLSAYPNPATNELTISHTSERAERVVMYDMTGALVRSGTVIGEAEWDIRALPSGSYMLGIPGGKMQVVQIVK